MSRVRTILLATRIHLQMESLLLLSDSSFHLYLWTVGTSGRNDLACTVHTLSRCATMMRSDLADIERKTFSVSTMASSSLILGKMTLLARKRFESVSVRFLCVCVPDDVTKSCLHLRVLRKSLSCQGEMWTFFFGFKNRHYQKNRVTVTSRKPARKGAVARNLCLYLPVTQYQVNTGGKCC